MVILTLAYWYVFAVAYVAHRGETCDYIGGLQVGVRVVCELHAEPLSWAQLSYSPLHRHREAAAVPLSESQY